MQQLAIVGPTATGKTALGIAVARRLAERAGVEVAAEIVSVDSMCVYRGMDIGTAKPTAEERAAVPHHLLDVADPWQDWSVADHQRGALVAIDAIRARGRTPILVGGTGLYADAVLDGLTIPGQFPEVRAELEGEVDTTVLFDRLAALDPVAVTRMEPGNRRRIVRALEVTIGSGRPFSSFGPGLQATRTERGWTVIGLRCDRELLTARIEARYRAQLAAGFLEEAARVLESCRARREGAVSRTAAQALGYRELWQHLDGECTLDEAIALAVQRTRQFAVRQERWFRRDPRVRWLDALAPIGILVDEVLPPG